MTAPHCAHGVATSDPCEACVTAAIRWKLACGCAAATTRFGEVVRCNDCGEIVDIFYPTADQHGAGDFDDRPRLFHDASRRGDGHAYPGYSEEIGRLFAALTPDQRHKAWTDWRAGPQCQQLLQDAAAGEREFSDALNAAFMAGIEAAVKS